MPPRAGRFRSARPGSTSGATGTPRGGGPGARNSRPKSAGCSPRTAAATAPRGSPRTCAIRVGGSARTRSRRSWPSSNWWPAAAVAAAAPPARCGPVAGPRPDRAPVRQHAGQPPLVRGWHRDRHRRGQAVSGQCVDMGSRRIVGFALGERHDAGLAYAALAMAVAVRGGKEAIGGVILHTDRGSEYTARRVRAACDRLGVRQSMGRPGSALDNAVIESWHSTLEFELRRLEHFATKAAARTRVAAWIEEYNHDRRHSALGMLSPIAYERSRSAPNDPPEQAA